MPELGDTLRNRRLARKLTLEEAEKACKVRRNFLEALEDERFDLLPPRAYAQGLLTVYARYLELDPYPLVRLLPPEPSAEPDVLLPPPPARQAPWRAGVLLGLLLLGAAGGYAYLGGLAAGPPPQQKDDIIVITMPTVTITAVPTATVAVATATVTPGTPSPTTTPPASTPVPTATAIAFVSLPSLTGQPLAQALGALQSMGLQGVTEQRANTQVPAGIVMEQQPAPGSRIPQGATVSLVVSRGPPPITVPNVVGRPEAEARAALAAAGLRPNQYTNYQGQADLQPQELARACVGCVLSTTPGGGAEVPPGTEVFIAVRKE